MASSYALIIGNSRYKDPVLAQLKAPDADVRALKAALCDPAIGGFTEAMVHVDATAAEMKRALNDFFSNRSADDLLLVYFSGHGVRDPDGQLYLAASDTNRDKLRVTAVDAQFISKEMDDCRSRRIVLILDCCHSGAFVRGTKGSTGQSVGTGPAFKGAGYGRFVLAASDATQYAWEGDKVIGEGNLSVFTHYLVEGLLSGQADSDMDGQISVRDLFDYVHKHIKSGGYRQNPQLHTYREEGDVFIARTNNPLTPEQLLTSVISKATDLLGVGQQIRQDNNSELLATLTRLRRNLSVNQPFTPSIAFVGVSTAGKSALINAILGEEILPNKATPTTAVPIRVRYAPTPRAEVLYINPSQTGETTIQDISIGEIDRYAVFADPSPYDRYKTNSVEEVNVYVPVDICRYTEFIDTPGIGRSADGNRLIENIVRQANIIVFVMSAIMPLSTTERNFINNYLNIRSNNIIFVFTRKGLIDVFGEDLKEITEFINTNISSVVSRIKNIYLDESMNVAAEPTKYFLVDSRQAQRAREKNDEKLLHDSGITHLEDYLWKLIDAIKPKSTMSDIYLILLLSIDYCNRLVHDIARALSDKESTDISINPSTLPTLDDMRREVREIQDWLYKVYRSLT